MFGPSATQFSRSIAHRWHSVGLLLDQHDRLLMHWQHPHVPHHNGFPQRVDHNPPVDIDNGQNDDDCYGDKECLLKSLHSIINVILVLFAMIVDAVGPVILIVVDVIQRLTSFVASFTVCFRHLIGDYVHKEL